MDDLSKEKDKRTIRRPMSLSPEDVYDFTFAKYRQEVERLRGPVLLAWEVTNACDMHCRHCGLDSGLPLEDELSTEEALRVLDELGQIGLKHLLLVGGEPLVRPDILKLAARGARYFTVGINTNGYRLDREMAERLREAGVSQVRVSLDGVDASTHDFLRREGSFNRAMEALDACLAQDFPEVGIQATLSQWNYSQLPDFIDLAVRLGVRVFEAREFFPVGRGKQMAHLALSFQQRQEMFTYLADVQSRISRPIITSEDPYLFLTSPKLQGRCLNPHLRELCIGCGAGILGCALKPNGKVTPCGGVGLEIGDLRRQSFSQIWQQSAALKVLRARDFKGKCGRCEYKYACGGCRAIAFAAGDLAGEDGRCWHEPRLPGS